MPTFPIEIITMTLPAKWPKATLITLPEEVFFSLRGKTVNYLMPLLLHNKIIT